MSEKYMVAKMYVAGAYLIGQCSFLDIQKLALNHLNQQL